MDAALEEVFEKLRQPAIWMRRTAMPRSQSRLGGLPSLPSGTPWPRQGVCKTPLHFLAQIDLGALPASPLTPGGAALPQSGLLLFFADMEEDMVWGDDDRGTYEDATRVIHGPAPGPETAPPADMPEIGHAWGEPGGRNTEPGLRSFPQAWLEAHVVDVFVGQGRTFSRETGWEADRRTLASIERATGTKAPVTNMSAREPFSNYPDSEGGNRARIIRHQMLGPASDIQGGAVGMWKGGTVSLLQLDTDWGLHDKFQFCDMGMAQFWIARDDLAAGRFEAAYATTAGG